MRNTVRAVACAIAVFLAGQTCAFADRHYVLVLQSNGSGFGTVHTAPDDMAYEANSGISLGSPFPANTDVDVTFTPAAGSVFAGWSGACTGTGPCRVHMDADKAVTVTVDSVPGTDGRTNRPAVNSPAGR
jgi:List-Bact-rpt repeat protein